MSAATAKPAAAAALALAALTIAGCASSSTSSSATTAATTATITKADFVRRANAICVKGNALSKAAQAKLGVNPTEEQIVTFVRSTEAPAVQAQIDAIRSLGAPPGDRATIEKMLEFAQAAVNKVKIVPTILTTGQDVFSPFAKIAHPYGLTACAPNSR